MAQVSYGTITITDITDIDNIQNYYLATSASSGVTTSTSGWTTGIQSMTSTNQYLWNYEQILGTGGVVINTTTPVIIGRYGQNGQPGVSITSIDEYYKANNSSTTKPTSWNAVNVIDKPTASNKYLWNYQVIHYSNNTTEGSASEARIIGVYGDKGEKGDDGISPTVSKSGSTVTITDAEGNIVTVSDGTNGTSYYTHIRYATSSAGANMTSTPTSSTIYIGIYSGTSATAPTTANSYTWSKYMGTNGTNGISVTKVTPIYYLKTSSGSVPTAPSSGTVITSTSTGTGVWTTAIPTYVNGGTYYTSTQTYLSGGTSPVSSTAVIDQALTTANSNAYGAYNVATGINQHFWSIESDYATGIPAGSYITDTVIDTFKSQKTGGNLLTRSDGIWIRDGIKTLASLTGSSFVFYRPTTTTTQGSKGMELTSSTLKFYDATGTITQATFGGTQATISGTINAYDGKIGNDTNNYWYIGNYTDYNQNDSAIIKSKGTASIQLNETDTWRISTNRIHTAWAPETGTDAFKLHFPKFNDSSSVSKYWDYGLHLPVSNSDKFLYIRNASGSETLDNLLNDLDDNGYNYWNYLFWVDASGNVHAPGFYIGNSTTPIGGGAGTVAERLTQGYGSATQPIYFNSNGIPTNTTYTLNAAGAKGVDTSIAAASTSTNLPTSKAVAAFVEGKGYITSYTDYRVKTEARGSTTMYLAGSNTSGTVSQGTLLTDSGVYIQTSSSSTNLVVPKVNGYTLAAASAKGVDNSIAAASTSTNLPTSKAVAAFVEGKGYKTTDNNTTYSLTQDSSDGHKITLTPSSGNAQTVTIPDNNTTYTFTNGTNGFTVTPSGGEAQTVTVTPSISNNITGTGTRTSGYLVKFSGTNTITNGPAIGTGTTKFLREDGTWVVPGGTYSLPTASSSTLGGVKVGSGLSISDGVLSHTDTSSQASSSNSGRTYIQSITLDTYGHVTALSTATETVTNTHNTAYLYAGKSDGTANAATTNGNTYLILMDGGSATTRRKVSGSGTVSVASDANGNITITGSAHPTSLKNPNALAIKIYNGTSTSSNTNYDGSTANQSVSVAGVGAITSIGISGSTLSWTKADGTTGSSTVTITASVASGSRILTDADGNALNVGSTNKPIYFSGGVPVTLKDGTNDLTIGKSVPSDAKFTDTWTAMVGATSSANGSVGYVNAVPPKDGYNTKFLRADGTWVVPGGTYSLPLAANGTRGGVQIGYTQSGKNYPVQLSSEKMYVNVPWENTWRGIQNNLTSDSTTDSLSAAQGKALANGSARDSTKLPLSGGTMTGQIKTSFKSSIATGSYQSTQTKIPELCEELRYSSGVMGSVNISTAYTKDGITIATGWYNFLWVPHRSGGVNGAASGDNCDYGSLYLSGMTLSGLYMIRYASKAIAEVKNLYKPPAAISADSATSAGKWTTARNFTIKDSDSTNSGTAVSVDGSAAVTLLLPSTIKASLSGNASTATKWASAQTVYVTLGTASTSTTIQGGSSSAQTIGVNGTLAISNGGTGLTASPSILTNLGSTTAANVLQASPRPGITGTLGAANGGTGQTSLINAANSLLNALGTGSSTPVDADYYISQYVNGGTTTTTYHRRPMSALWSYISGKISSSGTYVTVNTNQTLTAAGTKTYLGLQTYGSNGIALGVTSGTSVTQKANMKYDSTLEAIVFSFA